MDSQIISPNTSLPTTIRANRRKPHTNEPKKTPIPPRPVSHEHYQAQLDKFFSKNYAFSSDGKIAFFRTGFVQSTNWWYRLLNRFKKPVPVFTYPLNTPEGSEIFYRFFAQNRPPLQSLIGLFGLENLVLQVEYANGRDLSALQVGLNYDGCYYGVRANLL